MAFFSLGNTICELPILNFYEGGRCKQVYQSAFKKIISAYKGGTDMNLQKTISIRVIGILLFFYLIVCNSAAVAIEMDIEALQKEIDARGYKWKAGKTALSDLSSEESIKLFSSVVRHK
jgi:hypothetical protein